MPNKGLLLFNPYFGDTILSTALARKFSEAFEKEIYVGALNDEMYEFGTTMCNGLMFLSDHTKKILSAGSKVEGLVKSPENNRLIYTYIPEPRTLWETTEMCIEAVSYLKETFDEIFICHYSYPFVLLGNIAERMGLKVRGYVLDDDNIIRFKNNDVQWPIIWNKDYIGNRLSKLFTGAELLREDFEFNLSQPLIRNKVTLFPTSRSLSTNAKNWYTDGWYLRLKRGYQIDICNHYSEAQSQEVVNMCRDNHILRDGNSSIRNMVNIVQKSMFIICYDSFSFHIAWLTGTPAIVKLKGGFNYEWVPSWVRNDPKYYFIPAIEMYEEEYLTYLEEGLNQLGY